MALTTAAATALLNLLLNNIAWPNIGDSAGLLPSAADGVFELTGHTATPGVGGNQTTNECTYTSYARVPFTRDGSGFTVASAAGANALEVLFPKCTDALHDQTITYLGVGHSHTGAGTLHMYGALTTPIAVANNVQPRFPIGDVDFTAA